MLSLFMLFALWGGLWGHAGDAIHDPGEPHRWQLGPRVSPPWHHE